MCQDRAISSRDVCLDECMAMHTGAPVPGKCARHVSRCLPKGYFGSLEISLTSFFLQHGEVSPEDCPWRTVPMAFELYASHLPLASAHSWGVRAGGDDRG